MTVESSVIITTSSRKTALGKSQIYEASHDGLLTALDAAPAGEAQIKRRQHLLAFLCGGGETKERQES